MWVYQFMVDSLTLNLKEVDSTTLTNEDSMAEKYYSNRYFILLKIYGSMYLSLESKAIQSYSK